MLMYLNVFSTDSTHTEKFVYNFADINILRELKRIDGVGLVEIMGSRDYAMRVWLNPGRLAAYNMVPQDVTEAHPPAEHRGCTRKKPVSVRTNFPSSCSMCCSTRVNSVRLKNTVKLC